MSEEQVVVTWFPGGNRSVYSAVTGQAYGANAAHDPVVPLSGLGVAASHFGNNVLVLTRSSVVLVTVTLPGPIGAKALSTPLASLKSAASKVIGHLTTS
jgi:hypothetical protein